MNSRVPDVPPPVAMADLAPDRTAHRIIGLVHAPDAVELHWDDGRRSRFPAMWLRDNCPCPQCRHPQALERTYLFIEHPQPRIGGAGLDASGALELQFVQGDATHVSRFAHGWLRAHCCSPDALAERAEPPLPWDATIRAALPTVTWSDYMQGGDGMRAWIRAIRREGIVLMRGVPQQPGALVEVARRIGPIRPSNFGEYYDVVSVANPNASADTAMGLELHTDLANWRFPPDVQLLCCVKNSVRGGESRFADGLRVTQDLRAADPRAFGLLSTHEMEFRFHDATCDIRASAPAIELDRAGRFRRLRFNNWLRATLSLAEPMIEPVYAALGTLWCMLRDPRYHLELRLEAGELIAYDNNRVLHGRNAFDAASGERHLQGCYLNHEDLMSRLRLLDRG
jgi:gamma-butyrobetaine dioxygenase